MDVRAVWHTNDFLKLALLQVEAQMGPVLLGKYLQAHGDEINLYELIYTSQTMGLCIHFRLRSQTKSEVQPVKVLLEDSWLNKDRVSPGLHILYRAVSEPV